MANSKTSEKLANEVEQLNIEVSSLSVTIEEMNHKLKCDFTGWNIAESIAMLAVELKRYNDGNNFPYEKQG